MMQRFLRLLTSASADAAVGLQGLQDIFPANPFMCSDCTQNRIQGAQPQNGMGRNCNAMRKGRFCLQYDMAP